MRKFLKRSTWWESPTSVLCTLSTIGSCQTSCLRVPSQVNTLHSCLRDDDHEQNVLCLLLTNANDAPPVRTLGIIYPDDPSVHNCTEEKIPLMVQAVDAFVENVRRLVFSTPVSSTAIQGLFLRIVTFVTWSRVEWSSQHYQFYSNEDLVDKEHNPYDISPAYYYDTSSRLHRRGNSKKCGVNAKMREGLLLLKAYRHSNPTDSASSTETFGGWKCNDGYSLENAVAKDARSSGVTQNFELIEVDYLNPDVSPTEKAGKVDEISTSSS